ncbi:hypothetical protein [Pleurocapsa sp. FMAR1]|nr:hypothetical protein [Pleurocapsa sp. FMAR1]
MKDIKLLTLYLHKSQELTGAIAPAQQKQARQLTVIRLLVSGTPP